MPRFARMLEQAYVTRGHQVKVWAPQAKLHKLIPVGRLSKWAGYVDQYLLFPIWVRKQVKLQPADTLYVFCDQALGPWVPLVNHKPHAVHVHDLLALRSALDDVPENPTGWSGKLYQRYIRRGFKQAKHFISISNRTREDLHRFGQVTPIISEVVYNGLNYPYAPMPKNQALTLLKQANLSVPSEGMLLHLGGSQWYKNLAGVIRIYIEYAKTETKPSPLWCISPGPSAVLHTLLKQVPAHGHIKFIQGIDNQALHAAYAVARVFIFPSLAEGFGWPIIEAQACGCPVITTNAAPMNEIGGSAATYIPQLKTTDDAGAWSENAVQTLRQLLAMPASQKKTLVETGIANVVRFNVDGAIEGYLSVYQQVLTLSNTASTKNYPSILDQKATE